MTTSDATDDRKRYEEILADVEAENAAKLAEVGIPTKITRSQVIAAIELLGFDANQVYYLSLNDDAKSVSIGLADVGTKFAPGLLQTGLLRPFTHFDIEVEEDVPIEEMLDRHTEPRPDIQPDA